MYSFYFQNDTIGFFFSNILGLCHEYRSVMSSTPTNEKKLSALESRVPLQNTTKLRFLVSAL